MSLGVLRNLSSWVRLCVAIARVMSREQDTKSNKYVPRTALTLAGPSPYIYVLRMHEQGPHWTHASRANKFRAHILYGTMLQHKPKPPCSLPCSLSFELALEVKPRPTADWPCYEGGLPSCKVQDDSPMKRD